MGRDEHRNKKNSRLAQTPFLQLRRGTTDGIDVEYSEELADVNDRKAQARSRAADKRMKEK